MKLYLTFICLLLFCISHAQWYPHPSPLHKKDFAKVAAGKITVAFESETKGGELTRTRVLEFGSQGLPAALYTKGTNENGDSVNTAETIYKFDGLGRLIKETNEDKEDASEWTNIYTYSKDGKLLKKQTLTIDPATTTYTYLNGKVVKTYTTIKMSAVNNDGDPTGKTFEKPQQKETFNYDKAGRLQEVLIYNLSYEEGLKKWSRKIRFSYNENGQLSKRENINEEGKVYNTETYEYGENGLLKKSTVKTDDEDVKTFVYEYCTTCKQSWMK